MVDERSGNFERRRREAALEKKEPKTLQERAFEKIDVAEELKRLEAMLEELKIDYEQYFLGQFPYIPSKLHDEVKRQIRKIVKAPFKKPQMRYRLRMLESRYHCYNDYWQRVLRQKEEGTYSKDVFKANLRERNAAEDQQAQSAQGAAARSMASLFQSYKQALETQSGQKQNIDFKAFQKALLQRAKSYREQHGDKKLTFKVIVKDGKVSIQAKARDRS